MNTSTGKQCLIITIKIVYFTVLAVLLLLTVLVVGEIMSVNQMKDNSSPALVLQGDYLETTQGCMIKQRFPNAKPINEFRVFVVGGSQAMGEPYVYQQYDKIATFFNLFAYPNKGGISSWLEEYLKVIYPQKAIRVVNAAGAGQDSRWVLQTFREIKEKGKPDLIIILSGNNERSDPRLDVFEEPGNYSHYGKVSNKEDFEDVLSILSERYKKNLSTIANESIDENFLVYFLTIPTDLRDTWPIHSEDFDLSKIQEPWEAGNSLEIIKILKSDSYQSNALAHFYMARSYENLQEHALAKKHYLKAKDLDWAFFRSRSQWNDIVRNINSPNSRVIDMEAELMKYAKNGLVGAEFFADYCHLYIHGYQLMAYEIVRFLVSDQKLEAELIDKLKQQNIEMYKPWQLRVLYVIKIMKSIRLKYYTFKNKRNNHQTMENYQKSLRNVAIIGNLSRLLKTYSVSDKV